MNVMFGKIERVLSKNPSKNDKYLETKIGQQFSVKKTLCLRNRQTCRIFVLICGPAFLLAEAVSSWLALE